MVAGNSFRKDGKVKYTVYDLSGRALVSGNIARASNKLDISQLVTGIYLLEIQVDKRILKTLKFEKL